MTTDEEPTPPAPVDHPVKPLSRLERWLRWLKPTPRIVDDDEKRERDGPVIW